MNIYIGEIAALITALCFSFTSTFFTLAGHQVGSVIVNHTCLVFAVMFILISIKSPVAIRHWGRAIILVKHFWHHWIGARDASLFQAFI